jgi:hypothetical protein
MTTYLTAWLVVVGAGAGDCDLATYPTALGQEWTCPDCGKRYEAFDVLADERISDAVKRRVPRGTLGWRSRR